MKITSYFRHYAQKKIEIIKVVSIKMLSLFIISMLVFEIPFIGISYASNESNFLFYRVKPSDQLSDILNKIGACPLYGINGSVEKTIDINKHKISSDGRIIAIHKKIKISIPENFKSTNYSVNSRNEVIFNKNNLINHCDKIIATNIKATPIRKIASVQNITNTDILENTNKLENVNINVNTDVNIEDENYTERLPIAYTRDKSRKIASIDPSVNSLNSIQKKGTLQFLPKLYSFSISIPEISATTKINSASCYGLDINWEQFWNEKISTSFNFELEKISMQNIANKTWVDVGSMLYDFSFGLRYAVFSSLIPEVKFIYKNDLFFRNITEQNITIEPVKIFKFGLGLTYELISADPFKLGITGETNFGLPSETQNIKSKFSYEYKGSLFIEQELSNKLFLKGNFYYLFQKNKSTISNQNFNEITTEFGGGFKF